MRLTRLIAIVLGILIATLLLAELLLNPWRKSDDSIRARIFEVTPLGSKLVDVQRKLDQYGWHQAGYQQTWPAPARTPFLGGRVGGYRGYQSLPWYTMVLVFWEFDNDDRLIDIQIQRCIDSP